MANDSSTGGFIPPTASPAPLADAELDALLQSVVVGITELPGPMVRPRWQATVPKQPAPEVDWCAIGVTDIDQDDYPVEIHDSSGDGSDSQSDHETIVVLASFYGPNAQGLAKKLRSGLYVSQNRDTLTQNNMALMDAMRVIAAPDLRNEQWIRRYDLTIRFRRKSEYTYPILNLLSAPVDIGTDSHS